MPIYDYVCMNCGQRVEVIHSVHAAGPEACAACAGPMRKALSAPAIVFKGSGWAKKDARSASRSAVSGKDDKAKDDKGKDEKVKDDKAPAAEKVTSSEKGSGPAREATASASD